MGWDEMRWDEMGHAKGRNKGQLEDGEAQAAVSLMDGPGPGA